MSETLKVFLFIFIARSQARRLRAMDLSDEESDEHVVTFIRSSRGNAALAGIDSVTPTMLAYCVVQVCAKLEAIEPH